MEAPKQKEGGHISDILDRIEDFYNDPCEDSWRVDVAVSTPGTAVPGALDLDAFYRPHSMPHYVPPIGHSRSDERASGAVRKEKNARTGGAKQP